MGNDPAFDKRSKQKKLNILVVDDQRIPRLLGSKVVEKMGHTPITAINGVECLAKFKECGDIAVVVLDYQMPQMNGMDALKELMKIDPDVKVIICSADTECLKPEDFLCSGAKVFLAKPYDIETLRNRINELVDQ
jgi:two-component system chemotaxis response regulator CheY